MLDLLIRGGRVIDGAGNPWYAADVGIAGDRIAAVGRLAGRACCARRSTRDGLFVCPGFVDMHTHSDLQLLANPPHEAKVHQGVTLEVLGQDGLSYAPVTDEVLEQLRGQLAGWNDDPPGFDWSWRTVGRVPRPPRRRRDRGQRRVPRPARDDPHVRDGLRRPGADGRRARPHEAVLAEALEDGAVGLSTGLTYTPGMYADDDELVALLEVVREHGGFYAPHHRNYGRRALEAYADCIEIARRCRRAAALRARAPRLRDQQGPCTRAARDDRRARVTRASRSRWTPTPTSRARPTSTRSSRAGCTSAARARRSSASATRSCASGCASRWRTRAPTAFTRSRWTGRSSSSAAHGSRRTGATSV